MSAALKLAVFRNGDLVSEASFDGSPLWLGRGDECALRIEDRAISRKHALIHLTREGVEFEKKSKFGEVKVEGRDVSQVLLKGGECLKLGEFELRVSGEATVASATAAPVEDVNLVVDPEPLAEDPAPMMEDPPPVVTEAEPPAGEFDFAVETPDGATRVLDASVLPKKCILEFADSGSFYELGSEENSPVFIGRANCHVILEDRKSSRRHVSIEFRDGKHVLKDLGSSNGTLLNGEKLTGERELASGDEIQIGDTKFQYRMVQADYEQRQQEFLQVPVEPEPELAAPPVSEGWYSPPMESGTIDAPSAGFDSLPPPVQDFSAPPEEENRSLLGRWIDRYRMLPVRKQIIYGAAILAAVYFMLEEEEPVTRPTLQVTRPVPAAKANKEGEKKPGALPSFEALTPEQQAYVESQYNISFEHYKNRDYDSCLLEVGKIFSYVQDYKNAREIDAFAREGKRKLEAREEERKRKEAERQAQLRLQALIDQAGLLMEQKKYKEAEQLFPEIELMQPENQLVSAWKKIIIEEAARLEAERVERERIAKIRESLWSRYRAANAVLEEKKYFEALDLLDALAGQEHAEPDFEKAVSSSIEKAENAIAAERDPLLAEGRKFEAEGKQTEAYRAYQKAYRVDPTDTEAPQGMARIRDALNARARAIYSEGVIAEGFGELEQAEKKYREVLEVVPDDSEYFAKASGRIRRLTAYRYPASTEEKQ